MKRIFNGIMAMTAVALMALPACSGSGDKTDATTDTVAEAAPAPAAPAEAAPSAAVVELPAGTATLDEYTGKLTVVDFNAVWCGPCRKYGPTFHAVAEKMAGKANFISVNVDSCPDVAQKYVGQYIPQTTAILPDGRKFDKVGELTEEQLTAFIDSVAAL